MSTGTHQDLDSAKHMRTLIPLLHYKTIKNMVKCMLCDCHLTGQKNSHLFRGHDSLHHSIQRYTDNQNCYAMFSIDNETILTNFAVVFIQIMLNNLQDDCKCSRTPSAKLCPEHAGSPSTTPKTQFFCMHQFLHVYQKYLPKLRCKSIYITRV